MKDNRRDFIKKSTSLAAALSVAGLSSSLGLNKKDNKGSTAISTAGLNQNQKVVEWPVTEGPDTPKLCVGSSRNADEKQMRQIKQMGADYVVLGGPQFPWKSADLRAVMDRHKSQGLTVINMMMPAAQPNVVCGKEGRDDDIALVKESLIAAGAVGLPVVEYHFIVGRLMEGYYEKKGRGGSGITAFDYAPVKDLPPKSGTGIYTAEQLWDNLTYFLKEVIPVAEKAGVRLALHPNDPPVPISHESAQIIASFKDCKRLTELVNSPSSGMTFDCGVAREWGDDPLEVYHYLRMHDRVNHIHYRNVTVQVPHLKYEEVFLDTGVSNMFAIMRGIVGSGYKLGIYPEHPRALDYDKEHPGGIRNQYPGGGGYTGQTYNLAYTRAMMQAVQSL